MEYFPIFARLNGRKTVLVGGGNVALRKARLLLAAGARITVVAPALAPGMATLAASGELEHVAARFSPEALDGAFFVVAATDSSAINAEVFAAAERRQLLCNSVDDLAQSSAIVPAIVDRSPVQVAISTGGAAPVLARRLRERIEQLLPSGLGRLAALARRLRSRVTARVHDPEHRRGVWERALDSDAANAVAAGRGSPNDFRAELDAQIAAADASSAGVAWLVGAGPGDPELLTLRALRAMQDADVVLHDRLVSREILARVRRDAEVITVGKQSGCPGTTQAAINEKLVALVASGKRVCRLKGGDPFVFGRGGEEIEALRAAGLAYEIVPGITAGVGCAAYAGIPLTHREHTQAVQLVTAHGKGAWDSIDWQGLAASRSTLVFYMGVARLERIRDQLIAHGRSPDTPFAIVESGTTREQRVVTGELATLPEVATRHTIRSPAIVYVGTVAGLANELAWFAPVQSAEAPPIYATLSATG
ncbi:MAG: siroheme synthase CysG [Pseudomonadota bacterium]